MAERPARDVTSPVDVTIRTYEQAAERYRAQTQQPSQVVVEFLRAFAGMAGAGAHVLELGSGPGADALILEGLGLRVTRTDAAEAFLEMLRADGHEAHRLDVRTDDFGGPYDAVLADAVLLHLSPAEFAAAICKARAAVRDGGLFAMTLKEGDGSAWTTDKLDLPRHYTYWREPALRAALSDAAWAPVSIELESGRREPWLFALCRAV